MYAYSLYFTHLKVQEPILQHSLAKEMERSLWIMFLVMALKQCLPNAVTIPTLEIATMERMLVSGVMVSNNYNFVAHDAVKYCSINTSHMK